MVAEKESTGRHVLLRVSSDHGGRSDHQSEPSEAGLGFRGGPGTDHPGPDGPPPVQTRIWGAGPGPGAGPDQVFRARSRGFRALGREFSKGF